MKKLMIAAAVALAGIALNAASVQWSIESKSFLMSDGSTLPNGQQVYLLDASTEGFADLVSELGSGAQYGTFKGLAGLMADAMFTDLVVDSANTYTATTVGGQAHKKNYAKLDVADPESNTAPVDAGAKNNYAIFVAEGDNYLLSSSVEGIAYASSPDDGKPAAFGEANFLKSGEASGGASNWNLYQGSSSGVPEPTSGLLLLVGLAGLALKRRHA